MNKNLNFLIAVSLLAVFFDGVIGHGMVLDPVNRASRWKVSPWTNSAPRDYNDMEGFCGGYFVQWGQNGGLCGVCGDDYSLKTPRPHELGGTYGQGVIVKSYKQGQTIEALVRLTASHMGYFSFKICNLDAENETDGCFKYVIYTASGSDKTTVTGTGDYKVLLRLPSGLKCNKCVLQWTYTAGNNWGWCGDGTGKLGCGPQETFRTCSDIQIV
jgi:hypothetical protein